MPILRLRDRMRPPRLGKIRLGIKVRNESGKEYPKEVEYFVCPKEVRDKIGEEKPKSLRVVFPSNNVDKVLQCGYVRYDGGLLAVKCDGMICHRFPREGGEVTGPCKKPEFGPCECKARAVGRLSVIPLDADFGIYQVLLGGDGRIARVMSELEVYKETLGRLTDIVFEIERNEEQEQYVKEDGSRATRKGFPVSVRCNFTAAQALVMRNRMVGGGGAILGLEAGAAEEEVVVEAEDEPNGGHEEERADGAGEQSPAPHVRPSPEEHIWDISMCFSAAGRAGISAKAYTLYLAETYKTDVDNLPDEALHKEADLWREAEGDFGKLAEMVEIVTSAANRALKRK